MGAWGTGPFDNDDAADWLAEYEEEGASAVDAALISAEEQADDGYLEAPQGAVAMAACEVVAANFGRPAAGGASLQGVLSSDGDTVKALPDIRARCTRVLDRIASKDSELMQLWAESDDKTAFEAALGDLRARLQAGEAQ